MKKKNPCLTKMKILIADERYLLFTTNLGKKARCKKSIGNKAIGEKAIGKIARSKKV